MRHTSHLGQHRQDANGNRQTDTLVMTPGDYSLFVDYLEEAEVKIAEWLQAFMKNIDQMLDTPPAVPSVWYVLERKEYYNDNMRFAVERYVKNAFVYYVCYRWFEDTKPDEAERFYLKYEDAAQQAQINMNASVRPLHHNYNLF